MSSNLGHLGSKTRSLGQIKEIPCGGSGGHISCSVDLKIGRNVCLDDHISCSTDLKIGQNICLDEIEDNFKFGSPGGET